MKHKTVLIAVVTTMILANQLTSLMVSAETNDMLESTVHSSSGTTTSENIPKETEVETNYEDRSLEEAEVGNSSHPVIQFDEKELDGKLRIKGDISANVEHSGEIISKTILKKIILQNKSENTNWENEKEFSINENGWISEVPQTFDYESEIDSVKSYRFVVEYDIHKHEDTKLKSIDHHKAEYVIGSTLENSESIPTVTSNPTLQTIQNTAQIVPYASTTTSLPENTILYAESPAGNGTTNGKNSLGSQYVTTEEKRVTGWNTYPYLLFYDISSRSVKVNHFQHPMVTTNVDQGVDTNNFSYYFVWSTTPTFNASYMGSSANSVRVTPDVVNTVYGYRFRTNNVSISNLQPATTYYFWFCYTRPLGGYTLNKWPGNVSETNGGSTINGKEIYFNGSTFTTIAEDLGTISTPIFDQTSATSSSIKMNSGTYTGDVFRTNNQGKVQMKLANNADNTFVDKVTNLGHTMTNGGKYNETTVSGLAAGTKYKGRVGLKDYSGVFKYSGTSTGHYTTLNNPSMPEDPSATTSNDASFRAYYGATKGTTNGSHPTNDSQIDIQLSEDNSAWTSVTTSSSGFKLGSTPTINNNPSDMAPNIQFDVTGLTKGKSYYIRYRVKNDAGWSNYSNARNFTTKTVDLNIEAPTFEQSSVDSSSIDMRSGNYTGDIFQTNGQGQIQMKPAGEADSAYQNKISNLGHTLTTDGTYDANRVTGLESGTIYKGRVALKDYFGVLKYSGSSTDSYITRNLPDAPNEPTDSSIEGNSVSLQAHYGASKGIINGSHPTNDSQIDIQISRDNTTWNSVTTSSTGVKLESSPTIDNNPNDVEPFIQFKLVDLETWTRYYVRYRVENGAGWSNYSASSSFKTKKVEGLYLTSIPESFTFGRLNASNSSIETGLISSTEISTIQDFNMRIENFGVNSTWELSARLSNLSANDGTSLTGARMTVGKKLYKTTDEITWAPINSGFVGINNSSIVLEANGSATTVFKPEIVTEGLGVFRNTIGYETVKLMIPDTSDANGKTYQGTLTWTLDILI